VRNHDVLVDPDNKIAKVLAEEVGPNTVQNAAEICLKSGGWQADKQAKFQERRRLALARVKVDQGRQLARQGDVAGAIAAFQAAQQLDPAIQLEPGSTTPNTDPHAVAQHLVALTKVDQGRQLARQGNVEKALQAYAEAEKLDSSLATDAAFWNGFAWDISLGGDAAKGLEASEKAVALTAKDDPSLPHRRDTRGLARALTGNTAGAIEDFQAFMDSNASIERKVQRQEWVNALRKGQQPFTPQLLEQLWSQ
jgi:tetratricopeptide (TPR) repeat protein